MLKGLSQTFETIPFSMHQRSLERCCTGLVILLVLKHHRTTNDLAPLNE